MSEHVHEQGHGEGEAAGQEAGESVGEQLAGRSERHDEADEDPDEQGDGKASANGGHDREATAVVGAVAGCRLEVRWWSAGCRVRVCQPEAEVHDLRPPRPEP